MSDELPSDGLVDRRAIAARLLHRSSQKGVVAGDTASASPSVRSPTHGSTVSSSSKQRALIVDDVRVTQRVTSACLHQAGYICETADDGVNAVEMAEATSFDVILMDVNLPRMNGVDATIAIRNNESRFGSKRSVILGLTGSCDSEALRRYMSAGMDGCIEKGCVVSGGLNEALLLLRQNPNEFVFINNRNERSLLSNPGDDIVMYDPESTTV